MLCTQDGGRCLRTYPTTSFWIRQIETATTKAELRAIIPFLVLPQAEVFSPKKMVRAIATRLPTTKIAMINLSLNFPESSRRPATISVATIIQSSLWFILVPRNIPKMGKVARTHNIVVGVRVSRNRYMKDMSTPSFQIDQNTSSKSLD